MCSDTREAMYIFRTAKEDWVESIFSVGSEGLINVPYNAKVLIVSW